jgi:hypothetical protein
MTTNNQSQIDADTARRTGITPKSATMPDLATLGAEVDKARQTIKQLKAQRQSGYYVSQAVMSGVVLQERIAVQSLSLALDVEHAKRAIDSGPSRRTLQQRLAVHDALVVTSEAFAKNPTETADLAASMAIMRARTQISDSLVGATATERAAGEQRLLLLDLLGDVAKPVAKIAADNPRKSRTVRHPLGGGAARRAAARAAEARGERFTPETI